MFTGNKMERIVSEICSNKSIYFDSKNVERQ